MSIGIIKQEYCMNSVIKALYDRKSVRAYLDKPIPDQEQNQIIDAALQTRSVHEYPAAFKSSKES